MAIQINQIDETLAKQGAALSSLSQQVEVFTAAWATFPAGVKTAIKTHVSDRVAAIKLSLDDVTAAINSIP